MCKVCSEIILAVHDKGAYILVHIERSNVLSGVNLKGGVLWCVFSSVLLGIGFSLCYAIGHEMYF